MNLSMSLSRTDMPGNEVSVPLPDDGGNNQNGRLVRFEKYEGTVILGLAVFAVVAVTSFLPRAVMTIALVVVVVVFLLVWKKVKRRFPANAPPPPLETITSTDSPSDSDTQTCLSKVYDDRLAEYEAKMRTGISPVGLVPLLEVPAGGFMTQEERIVVVSKESDPEKVSTIISTLRKKTDKDYFNFCNILENSGNAHWAKRLRVSESPIASLDMGMMTPMGTVLSESSSVQPDMETQRIHQSISQDAYDKPSTIDDSRVPSDDELFELSCILLQSPFRYGSRRRFYRQLGIPSYEIRSNHRLEREFEVGELLIRWRDKYSFKKPSWRVLLSAIEDTYGHDLVEIIRSEFDLPQV